MSARSSTFTLAPRSVIDYGDGYYFDPNAYGDAGMGGYISYGDLPDAGASGGSVNSAQPFATNPSAFPDDTPDSSAAPVSAASVAPVSPFDSFLHGVESVFTDLLPVAQETGLIKTPAQRLAEQRAAQSAEANRVSAAAVAAQGSNTKAVVGAIAIATVAFLLFRAARRSP